MFTEPVSIATWVAAQKMLLAITMVLLKDRSTIQVMHMRLLIGMQTLAD